MPPLLLPEIVQSLQQSSAKKIFIDNLGVEHSPVAALSLSERIDWIDDVIGKKIIDGAIIPINSPEKDRTFNCKIMARQQMRMMSVIVMIARYYAKPLMI